MVLGPFSRWGPPAKLLENQTKIVPEPSPIGIETESHQKTGSEVRAEKASGQKSPCRRKEKNAGSEGRRSRWAQETSAPESRGNQNPGKGKGRRSQGMIRWV